ncbi:hypothetical protein [Actinoplanes sp. NBRC 103695]|uniref:SCO6745 family protein n=1 Tax=Actinoplanes sp. NBRC 103695 TaxID=3032202 RepID=UPI0024A50C56|nr:hypothetical protein [Actinoplanes sp. NBRC 103695]GLY98505.1 hypothetical protein Acsp02_57590 [Actinoplanes sp. NBRC 103695]
MTTESSVRLAWRVTEPLHAMIYFAPEAFRRFADLGLSPMEGYFASRGAVFGPAGPGPVIATFYNFHPGLVRRVLPAVWERTTPAAALDARMSAADEALRRGLGDVGTAEIAEAAGLARLAAESAAEFPQGRPLFAAHAGLPWPDEPHLQLFHAQTLLREFRGDGHVSALLLAGLTGLEANVLQVATGRVPRVFLQKTRGWSDDEWAAATDSLRTRDLVSIEEPATLTEAGQALLADLEATTDRLAEPGWAVLGEEGRLRLAELTRPLSRAVVKAGMLDPMTLVKAARNGAP